MYCVLALSTFGPFFISIFHCIFFVLSALRAHESSSAMETHGRTENSTVSNEQGPSSRGFSMESIQDADGRDITSEVNSVIRKLLVLQKRCNMDTRFHLIVERDVDDVVSRWVRYGSSSISECSRSETRILMSPTLSFETDEMKKISQAMTRQLNAASFLGMKYAIRRERETTDNEDRTPVDRSLAIVPVGEATSGTVPGNRSRTWEEFDEWEDIHVPDWFPFLYEEYQSGPQVSDTELLELSNGVVRKFENLSQKTIEAIWSIFFRALHKGVRKRDNRYRLLSFKYTMFTPPWLRKQIKAGTHVHRIGQVTIRPMRSQRSEWGYRTMALILAGYYEKERHFARPILLHILGNVNSGNGDYASSGISGKSRESNGNNRAPKQGQNSRRRSATGVLPPRPRKIRLDGSGRPVPAETNKEQQTTKYQNAGPSGAGPSTIIPRTTPESGDKPKDGITSRRDSDTSEQQKLESNNNADQRYSSGIACGAGSPCLFKLDMEAQIAENITGKCRKCRCPLHDLCGGGEEGNMLCKSCVRDQA